MDERTECWPSGGGIHMKRAVLYLRVSTLDQTVANQERELRQVAERAGWEIVHVYRDHGISGLHVGLDVHRCALG